MEPNFILQTDSYKVSHKDQYPEGTTNVYSYFESRGGTFDRIVFFGLQCILRKHLVGVRVTMDTILEAQRVLSVHLDPDAMNTDGWNHVVNDHDGKLPLSIHAVPEGTRIPISTPIMTVVNTCAQCYWLTNYVETTLVRTWYPTTVATLSREIKEVILADLVKSGDPNLIDFKLHDFGYRGSSSEESAGIGGMAHLVNFMGTDTMIALRYAMEYYDTTDMPAFSIPAAEHSTITSWGRDDEVDAYRNMLNLYGGKTPLFAVVSDSWDIYAACERIWGGILKDEVVALAGKSTLIIRPDSGDPPSVVTRVLDILGKQFGYTENTKGFKVLPPYVRVIQGDGINYDTIGAILTAMMGAGWSADNIAFGMGGGLLQEINRDTQEFAFKCSSITVSGEERDVWKEPVTMSSKNSKRGRFDPDEYGMVEVFRDGEILHAWRFDEVRERANRD